MKDVKPPQELIQRWRIDQYGPPYDGGWMNWPAGLITRMTVLSMANKLMRLYRQSGKNVAEVRKKYGDDAAKSIVDLLKVLHDND